MNAPTFTLQALKQSRHHQRTAKALLKQAVECNSSNSSSDAQASNSKPNSSSSDCVHQATAATVAAVKKQAAARPSGCMSIQTYSSCPNIHICAECTRFQAFKLLLPALDVSTCAFTCCLPQLVYRALLDNLPSIAQVKQQRDNVRVKSIALLSYCQPCNRKQAL